MFIIIKYILLYLTIRKLEFIIIVKKYIIKFRKSNEFPKNCNRNKNNSGFVFSLLFVPGNTTYYLNNRMLLNVWFVFFSYINGMSMSCVWTMYHYLYTSAWFVTYVIIGISGAFIQTTFDLFHFVIVYWVLSIWYWILSIEIGCAYNATPNIVLNNNNNNKWN